MNSSFSRIVENDFITKKKTVSVVNVKSGSSGKNFGSVPLALFWALISILSNFRQKKFLVLKIGRITSYKREQIGEDC